MKKLIIAEMVKDNISPYKEVGSVIPRIIYSNHPTFLQGCRFDYGYLQVALEDGYNIMLCQGDSK